MLGNLDSMVAMANIDTQPLGTYDGHLDSMITALRFLNSGASKKYAAVRELAGRAASLRGEIARRHQLLQQQMQNIEVMRYLRKCRSDLQYYQAQIKEYSELFNKPLKAEQMVISAVRKLPAFAEYFHKHSELAGLFRLRQPMDGAADGLLQSREMVNTEIGRRLGSGVDATNYFRDMSSQKGADLSSITEKLQLRGGRSEDIGETDSRINSQRAKSFFRRIEVGGNLQSSRGTNFIPAATDFGLSLAYRASSTSLVGVGGAYKMGWGSGVRDIFLSQEGIGLRTFFEMRAKGSFWLGGRCEWLRLSSLGIWQQNVMAGLSRKYQVGRKLAGQAQLLYDFLHGRNRPTTPALVFRVGYNLK